MPGFPFRLFRKTSGFSESPSARGRRRYVVRLAVYDSLAAEPRIIDLDSTDISHLLKSISERTYALSHEKGGRLPYVAIKEVLENLIHADFRNAVITILPDGNTIRVSDHGPGIREKEKAFLPGFTTADMSIRKYIRGVGSGLPIVKESLAALGGTIAIEDNLKTGCVVTLSFPGTESEKGKRLESEVKDQTENPAIDRFIEKGSDRNREGAGKTSRGDMSGPPGPQGEKVTDERDPKSTFPELERLNETLTARQKKVLLLTADLGEVGPSTIVRQLNLSLSTAYRDLVVLEENGLVVSDRETGKRHLTDKGIAYLSLIIE